MTAPVALDVVEMVRVAVHALLDGDPAVHAIVGRTTDCCVAWDTLARLPRRPVLSYWIVDVRESGGVRDTRAVELQVSAFAADERTAHALLGAAERRLTAPAFLALSPPLSAYRRPGSVHRYGADATPEGLTAAPRGAATGERIVQADCRLTLVVTT